jgi:hypothetical protein
MFRASELMTATGAATASRAADPAKFAAATPIWSAALAFPPSRLCPASRCPSKRTISGLSAKALWPSESFVAIALVSMTETPSSSKKGA